MRCELMRRHAAHAEVVEHPGVAPRSKTP